MLVKYKVAAYFGGHDHNMQHLNDSGVQYFLSGAGHLVESSQKHKVGKKNLKLICIQVIYVSTALKSKLKSISILY